MKKNKIFALTLSLFAVCGLITSCGGGEEPTPDDPNGPNNPGGTEKEPWETVTFTELEETNIGTKTKVNKDALSEYSKDNPLMIYLITDSGTLNDHSFNESAWKGVNEFAVKNGGGTTSAAGTTGGLIETHYIQPGEKEYTTQGRFDTMVKAVDAGANVLVLPGYLFQGAIKLATESNKFDDVAILALDCVQEDDEYKPYDYTENVTSVIYREEQAGFLAGYASVMDGYDDLGFIGGMAVPAVTRYGSGYIQGAQAAAKEKNVTTPIDVQVYFAGQFAATAEATQYATTWYQNGYADIIFACGGAVYESVVQGSTANDNAPWIGVDVNQHADTSLGADVLGALKTSAMKNLQQSVEVMLTSWVDEGNKWKEEYAAKVKTVGAQSGMCKLPTPEADNDPECWGFENFTVEQYEALYAKLQDGSIKVNSFSDSEELGAKNFGVDPKYVKVNYVK